MKRSRSSIQQESTEPIPHIPSPIIFEILSYLPVKSVIGSKTVSKTWLNLISDPDFAKLHFEKSPRGLFLHTEGSGNVIHFVELRDASSRFKIAGDIYIPHKDIMSGFISTKVDFKKCFMSSCNGLLCFCEARSNPSYYICNPFTRDYTIIPPLEDNNSWIASNNHWRSEFGFSPKTHQFKVLRISHGPRADIFVIGKKSWRSIDVPGNFYPCGTTAFLNGTFHWLSYRRMILSFDVGDEMFQELPFPPQVGSDHNTSVYHYSMGILEECISLCCGNYDKGKIEIWRMKEYGVGESWIKQFVIEDSSKFLNYLTVRWIMEDGEKVILVCNNNIMVSYDPSEGVCRFIKFDGLLRNISICPHVPRLTSVRNVIIWDDNSKDENEVRLPGRSVDSEPSWVIDRWSQPIFIPWRADYYPNLLYPQGENESSSIVQFPSEVSVIDTARFLNKIDVLSRKTAELWKLISEMDNEVVPIINPRASTSEDTLAIVDGNDDGRDVEVVDDDEGS